MTANAGLRKLEAASLLWSLSEYMSLVGLLAVAYMIGGPGAVAALAIIQAAPSVVLAPIVMAVTAGMDRDVLLRRVVTVRLVALGGAALLVDLPAVVLALAAVDALASTVLRPVRGTLTPALARTPEELVATNVALGLGTSGGGMAGPAIAAALLVVAGPAVVLGAAATGMALALAVALGIRVPGTRPARTAPPAPSPAGAPAPAGQRSARSMAGLDTLRRSAPARLMVLLIAAQRFARGMLTVLVAAVAIDGLALGDTGVGVLSAALGLGSLIGAVLSAALVRRTRLAAPVAAALALWGGGLLAGGAVPQLTVVAAGLAVAGIGRSVFDVAWVSLLQRLVPSAQRSAVLGIQESVVTTALALGSLAAAALVAALGPGPALVVAGAVPLLVTALTWPVLRSLDDRSVIPQHDLTLLHAVPLFRPLPLDALERVAASLVHVELPAGEMVVRQGEPGDRYYLVERGRLEVTVDASVTRQLGPGDGFGEIALMRDVPRTATVRALEPVRLATLARDPFLAAVTGFEEAASAAETMIRGHLGAAGDR